MLRCRLSFLCSVALTCALVAPAHAEEGGACVSAYEEAQVQHKNGDFVRAKSELELCLGTCPTQFAAHCTAWLEEVRSQLASLEVVVESGSEPVTIVLDGVPRKGLRFELNPGKHVVHAEGTERASAETTVSVSPGQRATITLALSQARRPLPPLADAGPAPFVLGGLGLAGLTAGGVLAIVGHAQVSSLEEECAPNCPEEDAELVIREWVAGGIVGGVGLVSLVTGIALYAVSETAAEPVVSVSVTPDAAFASLRVVFQ